MFFLLVRSFEPKQGVGPISPATWSHDRIRHLLVKRIVIIYIQMIFGLYPVNCGDAQAPLLR